MEKQVSDFVKNGGTYRKVGDYYIPNITISSAEADITLGVWGMRYKQYLKNSKRLNYNMLILKGTLMQHCHEVELQAEELYSKLVADMAKSEGITEKLKEENQMEWVGRMNNIRNRAWEIVNAELIYGIISKRRKNFVPLNVIVVIYLNGRSIYLHDF